MPTNTTANVGALRPAPVAGSVPADAGSSAAGGISTSPGTDCAAGGAESGTTTSSVVGELVVVASVVGVPVLEEGEPVSVMGVELGEVVDGTVGESVAGGALRGAAVEGAVVADGGDVSLGGTDVDSVVVVVSSGVVGEEVGELVGGTVGGAEELEGGGGGGVDGVHADCSPLRLMTVVPAASVTTNDHVCPTVGDQS